MEVIYIFLPLYNGSIMFYKEQEQPREPPL